MTRTYEFGTALKSLFSHKFACELMFRGENGELTHRKDYRLMIRPAGIAVTPTSTSTTHSWRQAFAILKRHSRKSLYLFALIVAATVIFVVFAPRKYVSRSEYLVRLGHESVSLDPIATVGQTMGLHMTADSIVRSTREVIASERISAKVVEKLGVDTVLDRDPTIAPGILSKLKGFVQQLDPITDEEKARITIQRNLKVHSPSETNVIFVEYYSPSPYLAHQVLSTMSEVFLEEHSRINHTAGSFEFFIEQNAILQDQLDCAADNLAKAKKDHAISSVEGKRTNLENRLSETQAGLLDFERQLASSEGRINQLTEELAKTDAEVVIAATSGLDQQTSSVLRQQLNELSIREKELLSKFTADHPSLQAVQEQLKAVQAQFDNENLSETQTSRGMNPLHQDLSIQLNAERANRAAHIAAKITLTDQLASLMTELATLNEQERDIFRLQTELDVAKLKYEAHASKLEQARLEQQLGDKAISSIGVIESPRLHERPVSPNKPVTLVLGLFAACLGAFCLPFAIEYLREDPVLEYSASPMDVANGVARSRGMMTVHSGHESSRTRESLPPKHSET